MDTIIDIKRVNKNFRSINVLNNITVKFETGLVHGIVGKNGSGKTLMAKLICGLLRADTGEVRVNGQLIGKETDFPLNTGAIIETPGFIPYYSGYKNLEYLASFYPNIKRKNIEEIMISVGLNPTEKKHVGKYSLGMKQRLGIAQSLLGNPKLLVLDEPFNGLDHDGVIAMRDLLKQKNNSGVTILLASHYEEDISILCHKTYQMEAGKIYEK